ncbi:hypothetical protein FisN_29Lh049 [Fistulifera solaris]|uniref:Uncharacterized protein n=1 Tax=Fistulifera solaris TaxID=1519565 RepID=W8W0T4_FISSO|nr:hypothetical protein [Fistulifera solaris]GAX14841.1 hypothetical protein FisN_29Lh049 [Fistulifera solaris]|eukprot:GAX14841.1 hypothetical protein FisN_29Lh049 [Fistulifera solaris]
MILLYKPTLLCFMILVVQAQRNTEESNRLRGLVSDNSVVVSDMRVFPMYDAGSTDDDWSDDDMSSGKGKKSSNGKGKGKDSYSKSSGEEYSKSSAKGSAKGGSSGKASKKSKYSGETTDDSTSSTSGKASKKSYSSTDDSGVRHRRAYRRTYH